MVRVQVPATAANLGPGFDCLGMALKMYNMVEMTVAASGVTIEVSGEGARDLSRDETNMVYNCAARVFETAGFSPPGLKIRLINSIPLARGLGSSAAAIVGGLVAANVLCGGKLDTAQLLKLAVQIEGHPDNVTPALIGGITVYTHAEGEINYLKINPPPGLKAVIVVPDFTLSTRSARDVLPKQLPLEDAVFNIGRAALLVGALLQGKFDLLGVAMEDRLHQNFRSSMIPGLKKVFAAARLAGARGVALSGAGPAVVALVDKNPELIAAVMRDTFYQNGVRAKSLVVDLSPVGARALEIKQ